MFVDDSLSGELHGAARTEAELEPRKQLHAMPMGVIRKPICCVEAKSGGVRQRRHAELSGNRWREPLLGEPRFQLGRADQLDLGRFPADECSGSSLPIDPDAAHVWFGGASARTVHSTLRAALPKTSTARWLDGTSTQMTVALDELIDQRVCLAAAFGDPVLSFGSGTRLQSADGRIDSSLPSSQSRLLGTSGVPQNWSASKTGEPLPSAESADGIQLSAEMVAGHDSLRASFELWYEWQNDTLTGGGIVDVDDSVANQRLDCAAWPLGSEYQQRCRTAP